MKPNTWGKYYWYVIHITALGYPKNPTQKDRDIYRSFYKTIGQVLPCGKCSTNYERHFQNIPIDMFLESPETLFRWTVQLHNVVNKELGKKQWSIEFAESYYRNLSHNYRLETKTNFPYLNDTSNQNTHSMFMIFLNILVIIIIFLVLWMKIK